MTAIKIEHLVKTYGSVKALDGLNLNVDEGSIFGFLGPNGAGKTTTMRILAGLAQATSGKAWINNVEVDLLNNHTAGLIGYLPEEPAFYTWMTPKEYLDFIGRIFGMSPKERAARTDELLELTELKAVSKRRIGGFSRGMRQRLGLAQALVNHPKVLLLDEPVSALDPAGRKEALELISRMGESCTVLMSTHILADVDRICDTVGIINQGRLVIQANRIELLEKYATSALEIELGNGSGKSINAWKEKLAALPGVQGVAQDGYTLRVAVQGVQRCQREIMTMAVGNGLVFERLEVVKPSLEDIFLRLVEKTEVTK